MAALIKTAISRHSMHCIVLAPWLFNPSLHLLETVLNGMPNLILHNGNSFELSRGQSPTLTDTRHSASLVPRRA